jgi:hypothetical protein
LNQLNDLAAHQIDRRDQHGSLMGMPFACRTDFKARISSIPK